MPIIHDDNDKFGRKLSDLIDLVLEGDITHYWEVEFIEAMVDRFEKGHNFTDNMVFKVNELHDKHYV